MIQNDILLKHLSTVMDPELGVNIVDLGMVKNLTYNDSEITIDLALTIAECPMRNQIESEIKRKLKLIENVKEVKINVVAMNKEDRASLMSVARKNAREKAVPTQINTRTRVIAIGSGKGGVGKSTISTNLAVGLEKLGFTTGLLDADIWGFSIPRLLGIEGRLEANEEKKIIPYKKGRLEVVSTGLIAEDEDTALMWRGLMLSKALEQFLFDVAWGNLDYLVIDLPPGTGDIQMALGRLLPQTELLVITTPQPSAQKVATRVADMAKRSFIPLLGVVENMSYFETSDKNKYQIFGKGGGDKLAEKFGIPLLSKVPISETSVEESENGIPILLQENESPTKDALQDLVTKITKVLPPISDETCTGRLAKVLEELEADQ